MTNHRFETDKHYENREGLFKVLKIVGERMLIEWDDGRRVTTTTALQEKIITKIEKEAREAKAAKTRKQPRHLGRAFEGLKEPDFSGDVTGTHWRSRKQLGGAVTSLLDAERAMNSWSIYRRPEVHWAAMDHYDTEEPWVQGKFFLRLDEVCGTYGYYIERSDQPGDDRLDWLKFVGWLGVEENVRWLHALLSDQGMSFFDPYAQLELAFNRTIVPDAEGWRIERPGEPGMVIGLTELAGHLEGLDDTKWLNLLIGRRQGCEEMIAEGVGVAEELAKCFNRLMPVYEGAVSSK